MDSEYILVIRTIAASYPPISRDPCLFFWFFVCSAYIHTQYCMNSLWSRLYRVKTMYFKCAPAPIAFRLLLLLPLPCRHHPRLSFQTSCNVCIFCAPNMIAAIICIHSSKRSAATATYLMFVLIFTFHPYRLCVCGRRWVPTIDIAACWWRCYFGSCNFLWEYCIYILYANFCILLLLRCHSIVLFYYQSVVVEAFCIRSFALSHRCR